MEFKYKIWIEKNGKLVFGKGREDILKAINEQYSLNAAAQKIGMSYRGAWGKLKVSEERMGMKLVDISENQRSSQLTQKAQAIIDRYKKLENDMEQLIRNADRDFEKLIYNI